MADTECVSLGDLDNVSGEAYRATDYESSDTTIDVPRGGISLHSPSFSTSSSVEFTRASGVHLRDTDRAETVDEKSFNVSIASASEVIEPTGLYNGLVNSSCANGLSINNAEDGNSIILSYSPPTPPALNLDISLPDKPDFSVQKLSIDHSNLTANELASMPELFYSIESSVTALVDNILGYLSDDEVVEFNEKIFRGSAIDSLAMMGISTPSSSEILTREGRQKSSIARGLLILSSKAKNTTVGKQELADLNGVAQAGHATHQIAMIDTAKANTSIALQEMSLATMLYNNEVSQANIDYREFSSIARIEVEKLSLYQKQIAAIGSAIDGNNDLVLAYKKQISIVKQVFDSFEDAMKLSEAVLNLATTKIQVETENIKTATMLVDGDADQANNRALQADNANRAYGLNTEAQVAKGEVDVIVKRAEITRNNLIDDKDIKNKIISYDNDYVKLMASSVSTKIKNVETLFGLDILGHKTSAELSFLSSHRRALDAGISQAGKIGASQSSHHSAIRALGIPSLSVEARKRAWIQRINSLSIYKNLVTDAGALLAEASTTQALIHEITSA